MATSRENNRAAAMRADIQKTLSCGISLASPTVYCLLNGVPDGTERPEQAFGSLKNVLWSRGGSSYDWRHLKYRGKANQSTGPLRVRSFSEEDMWATPTISTYMFDKTWGLGEGDLADNRHAGPQKQIDMKRESFALAVESIYAEYARAVWAPNATNQNAGLSLFSPTNADSASYAGIAMNSTTTNGTDTFYYWSPTGYDYGTDGMDTDLLVNIIALKDQMTFSLRAGGGGGFDAPDFAVCAKTMWPVISTWFQTNASFNIERVSNLQLLANRSKMPNIIVDGIAIFPDDNFGGSTGYIDAAGSALEDVILCTSSKFRLSTTNTKAEGLITTHATGKNERAWLAGECGVAVTGKQGFAFLDPRGFQLLYT